MSELARESVPRRSLRVGVIGAGIMGADHANTLRRSVRGAEVTAVADVDLARAEAAAEGSRAYDDAFALIADPAVDAVVIASHDSVHAAQVVAAVRAGKAVLCEKPLAPTLAEGRQVLREIGATGEALLSLGFMRRFDPGYVQLRQAIDDGSIGAPVLVHNVSRGVSSAPNATSEFSVTGSAIHECDVVPWLLRSPVVEVSWVAPRRSSQANKGLQDPQLIHLRTADGVLSTVETFLNARYGYVMRCEVVGENGTISLTAGPGRCRGRAQAVDRLCRRLAAPVRRRLPPRAAGVGRLGAGRRTDTAGHRARRRGRQRRGRGRHRVDARRWPCDEGGDVMSELASESLSQRLRALPTERSEGER